MARGKFRGIMARRLEDLSAEQVIELTRALSSLIDAQNAQAAPPKARAEEPPAEEPFDPSEPVEDVPF